MKHIDGNLRPIAALSRGKVIMLPSARIQCAPGRIRVGDRTYLSASDALSAYLQQFDGKQQSSSRQPGSAVSASSAYSQQVPLSSGMDGLVQRAPVNHFVGSASTSRQDPTAAASVTGLLTGSPRGQELGTTTLNNTSLNLNSHGYTTGVSFQDSTNVTASPRLESSASAYNVAMASRLESSASAYGQSLSKVNGFHGSDGQFDSTAGSGLGIVNGPGPSELSQTPAVPRAKSEIETLLSSQLPQEVLQPSQQLIQTPASRRQMAQDAQDTLREVKLKRLMTEEKNRSNGEEKKSSLQQEVEEALSRSAQLLETIQTDVLVSPRCVSDVGSLSTEVLLSVNPYQPNDAVTGRQSRSRHRYSYHTPVHHHTRSLSLGRVPGAESWQPSLRESGRRRSVDSLGPSVVSSLWKEKTQDVNSSTASSISALSDPSDILKHLRSHSDTPYAVTNQGDRNVGQGRGPPSWIQELIPSSQSKNGGVSALNDVTSSIFSPRDVTGGRAPPSWVNGMDQSDIASSVDTQELRDAAEVLAVAGVKSLTSNGLGPEMEDSVLTDLSYAGPGLNYSDLVTSPAPNKHKVSFSSHLKPPSVNFPPKTSSRPQNGGVLRNRNGALGRRDADSGKPPIGRIHQDLAGVDMVRPKSHNLSGTLSSSLGAADSPSQLRKKITEDSDEARRTMSEYLARLCDDVDDVGRTDRKKDAIVAGIPRCSSLDALNGLGPRVSVPSDVTGASSIPKDSNFSSKLCLDDPTLTPARQARTADLVKGQTGSPELEDLLDGDRPWENMAPSFKAPVQVGNSSPGKLGASAARPSTPTLSGGQQPGSMEALKQMLFRLQTEENSSNTPASALAAQLDNGGASDLIPALADYNFEDEPGGQSLERALVHLGRLKTLVQTTGTGGKKEAEQSTA